MIVRLHNGINRRNINKYDTLFLYTDEEASLVDWVHSKHPDTYV